MSVRRVTRRNALHWVIDIRYVDRRTGCRARYRHDAAVQTSTSAHAEERRLLVELAERGFIATPEELRAANRASEPPATSRPSFRDAVKTFRRTKAVSRLKRTTRVIYDVWLDVELLPRFGDRPLDEVDYLAVAELDAELCKQELKPSSRRNIAIALRSVLRNAVEVGSLVAMPKLPPLPKVGETVIRPPAPEDVETLIRSAAGGIQIALALAADAGLRSGEIRGLEWQDVDLRTGTIRVRQAIYFGEPDTPKSGHQREVPVTARLLTMLKAAAEKPHAGTDPVAPSRLGTVWGQGSLAQAFRRALAKLKLPAARLHDLRHFFVTRCFRAGVDARTVQALAGHHHLSVTARYAHTSSDAKRAAMVALDGLRTAG